jgi:hypothetical protein
MRGSMSPSRKHYRRWPAWPLLGLAAALLSGCGIRDVGLADRCTDLMEEAFPGGKFKVTKAEAAPDPAAPSITGVVARVEATRTDVPAGGALAHDVAVECRFEGNVLIQFRWTKGPLLPPSASP